ncbi:MAG TPA: DUF3784 domain-containing protein [Ruminiclostridium sp.]|nr:DUF3784 domain-containing protein [Ruminiclostridium sp.]
MFSIIGIIFVGLFAVMSIILLSGRGGFLISGYNTAGEEERARYDEKKLCRAAGTMLLIITIATAALFLCLALRIFELYGIIIYIIIVFASVAVGIYYTNTKCYKTYNNSDVVIGIKEVKSSQQLKKEKKKRTVFLIIVFALIFAVTAGVIVLILNSAKPTVFQIKDGNLNISTEFGETVSLSDIENVQIKDSLPGNLNKINGSNLGNLLKGTFESGTDELNVYVDASKPPFLYVYTKNGLIIINGQTKTETQSLYNELQKNTSSK